MKKERKESNKTNPIAQGPPEVARNDFNGVCNVVHFFLSGKLKRRKKEGKQRSQIQQ